MKNLAFVFLLIGGVVSTFATYGKQKYAGQQAFCYDYIGRPIRPGQSYYDGCNTCICGQNGMPTICTLRFCGNANRKTGVPVNPMVTSVYSGTMYLINPAGPRYPAMPVNQYTRRSY